MIRIENPCCAVEIVPEWGGRLMGFRFQGRNLLFANPLFSEGAPSDAQKGGWFNYGGEKIWPAPQGWDDPQRQWAGPPDPVLDGGVYQVVDQTEDSVSLASPIDPKTGLQIFRTIHLVPKEARVEISATFRNHADEHRKWSIWPVVQVAIPTGACEATVPVAGGTWRILHGLVNNPQFVQEGEMLRVRYQRLVGKVGVSAPADWAAFSDLERGIVLVARAESPMEGAFPDAMPVQIWTSGRGAFYSRGALKVMSDDERENPRYLELELFSPMAMIPPKGEMRFRYSLAACCVPRGESVQSVSTHEVRTISGTGSFAIAPEFFCHLSCKNKIFL